MLRLSLLDMRFKGKFQAMISAPRCAAESHKLRASTANLSPFGFIIGTVGKHQKITNVVHLLLFTASVAESFIEIFTFFFFYGRIIY